MYIDSTFSFVFDEKILNSYAKTNNSHFDIDKSHFPFFQHIAAVDVAFVVVDNNQKETVSTANKNNNKWPLTPHPSNTDWGLSYFANHYLAI